ncbi:MAG: DUF4157 domain-containing protein, partial [Planctomycetota bacterium]
MRSLLLLPLVIGIDLWIRWQVLSRRDLRRRIDPAIVERLNAAFSWPAGLFDRVRLIPGVPPVPGIVRLFERWRPDTSVGPGGASGITFGWDVVVRPELVDDEALLFHELVHVVQWSRLGRLRFLLVYADGVLRHGYLGCPLEEIAYRMTSAFAAGLGDAGPVGREVAEDADTQGAVLR